MILPAKSLVGSVPTQFKIALGVLLTGPSTPITTFTNLPSASLEFANIPNLCVKSTSL